MHAGRTVEVQGSVAAVAAISALAVVPTIALSVALAVGEFLWMPTVTAFVDLHPALWSAHFWFMFTALVSFWLVPLASTQTGPLAQMLEDLDGKLDEGGSEEDFLRANAIVVIVFLVAGPLLAWTCIGYCVVWERQRRVCYILAAAVGAFLLVDFLTLPEIAKVGVVRGLFVVCMIIVGRMRLEELGLVIAWRFFSFLLLVALVVDLGLVISAAMTGAPPRVEPWRPIGVLVLLTASKLYVGSVVATLRTRRLAPGAATCGCGILPPRRAWLWRSSALHASSLVLRR
jgi:hypothetical protein